MQECCIGTPRVRDAGTSPRTKSRYWGTIGQVLLIGGHAGEDSSREQKKRLKRIDRHSVNARLGYAHRCRNLGSAETLVLQLALDDGSVEVGRPLPAEMPLAGLAATLQVSLRGST
jgi:hypothetical protein